MKNSNIFAFDSDEEAKFALRQEGQRLNKIANRIWDEYLASYQPQKYIRTNKSKKSIKLSRVKRLDAYTWGVELMFIDDLAYHDSVMGGKHKQGHSIMLISEGWRNSSGNNKSTYRFGYFEGIDFIGRVQREFDNGVRAGINLEVNWAGKPFKKQRKQDKVLRKK